MDKNGGRKTRIKMAESFVKKGKSEKTTLDLRRVKF